MRERCVRNQQMDTERFEGTDCLYQLFNLFRKIVEELPLTHSFVNCTEMLLKTILRFNVNLIHSPSIFNNCPSEAITSCIAQMKELKTNNIKRKSPQKVLIDNYVICSHNYYTEEGRAEQAEERNPKWLSFHTPNTCTDSDISSLGHLRIIREFR